MLASLRRHWIKQQQQQHIGTLRTENLGGQPDIARFVTGARFTRAHCVPETLNSPVVVPLTDLKVSVKHIDIDHIQTGDLTHSLLVAEGVGF